MTTNTKSAQERTASINLAQLDKLIAEVERLNLRNGQDFHRWEQTANTYRYRAEKAEAEVERLRAELAAGAAKGGNTSKCVGCEGSPSAGNNPCAVCGRSDGAAGTVEKDALRWLCDQGWFQDAAGHFLDIPDDASETVAEFTREVECRIRAAIEAHNRAGKEQG